MTFDVPITQRRITGHSTIDLSRMVTRHLQCVTRPIDPIEQVLEAVCSTFRIERDALLGSSRPERIAWPRQIGMDMAYSISGLTLAEIGERFGGRNHGTVIHAVKRVKSRCETDKKSREQYERVKALLA